MNEKLLEELVAWKNSRHLDVAAVCGGAKKWWAGFDEILSRHSQEVEPLAVLAYLKGQVIVLAEGFPSYYNDDKNADVFYAIRLADKRCPDNWREFRGATYTAAEDKARQYLEGLSDVKGEGIDRAEGKK